MNTMIHLATFHFRRGFPGDGTVIYDIELTANQGPTYNEWFNM